MDNLKEALKTYDTVQALLEGETENGSAKNTGSHCRNLVRLKRVIDLVRVMLEQVLASEYAKNTHDFGLKNRVTNTTYKNNDNNNSIIFSHKSLIHTTLAPN